MLLLNLAPSRSDHWSCGNYLVDTRETRQGTVRLMDDGEVWTPYSLVKPRVAYLQALDFRTSEISGFWVRF